MTMTHITQYRFCAGIALLVIGGLLAWRHLRLCPELAEECWEPWRDTYCDRLEAEAELWGSYYEANAL